MKPQNTSPGPLAGIRVLEIASMILGPLAGQYLGDLGADVIKLEPPEGDLTRSIGPRRSPLMGSFFLSSNRSKRSIVVDLKKAEGQAILRSLLKDTDVLLHSLRTPAANKLGLDYETLKQIKPSIVYCHVTGYSDEGAYAGRPAYDDIGQAASGLAQLQTAVAGQPRFMPSIFADKIGALHASIGMLACVNEHFLKLISHLPGELGVVLGRLPLLQDLQPLCFFTLQRPPGSSDAASE